MAFADILAQITEATDREALTAVADKYPTFRAIAEDGERHQSLRSTLVSAGVAADKVDAAIANTPAMFKWSVDNYDFTAGMTHQEKAARAETAEIRRQYDDLVAKGDTDMDIDTIIAGLKEKGFVVSKDDLKDFATRAEVGSTASALTSRFENVYSRLTPRAVEHAAKFGEAIPMDKIFDYMREQGITDPDKAYDAYMAPKMAELRDKSHKDEVAAAELRGKQAGMAEAATMVGRAGMPLDNGGSRKLPHFMAKVMAKRGAPGGEGRLGDGTSAKAATDAYRQKQVSAGAA